MKSKPITNRLTKYPHCRWSYDHAAAPKVRTNSYLHSSCSSYSVLNVIGQGCYGKVAKCQNLHTKELVAIKILKPDLKQDITKEVDCPGVILTSHQAGAKTPSVFAGVHAAVDRTAEPRPQQLCQVLWGVPVHGANLPGVWNTGEESQWSDQRG